MFDERLLAITKTTFLEDRTNVRKSSSPGLFADADSGGGAARHFFVFIGFGLYYPSCGLLGGRWGTGFAFEPARS